MAKGRNFYYGFVDLQKAHDRVPRQVKISHTLVKNSRMVSVSSDDHVSRSIYSD